MFQNLCSLSFEEKKIVDSFPSSFKVIKKLEGSMGIVFIIAENGKYFILKTIKPRLSTDRKAYDMLLGEAEIGIRLGKHPNIVETFKVGDLGGLPCIYSEYIDGESLDKLIAKGGLTLKESCKIAGSICNALIYAYEKLGLLHRDLKTRHCLIAKDGTLKLIDFGVSEIGKSTRVGALICGTPAYMPPESLKADYIPDQRLDIFAFGVILYELCTGVQPFKCSNISELLVEHEKYKNGQLDLFDKLPKALKPIIEKSIAYSPEARYSNFKEILAELSKIYLEHFNEELPKATPQPLNAEEWMERGVSMQYLKKRHEAIYSFDMALQLDSSMTTAIEGKGDAFYELELYPEALENYQIAEATDDRGTLLTKIALTLDKLDRPDEAEEYFKRAYKKDENNSYILEKYAEFLINHDKFKLGCRYLEYALKSDPNNIDALFFKGSIFLEKGNYTKADLVFCKILELMPRHIDSLLLHGQLLSRAGNYHEAIQNFKKILSLTPGNQKAWFELQRNRILAKRYYEAQTDIAIRMAERPEDPDIQKLVLELHLEKDNFFGALQMVRKLLKSSPSRELEILEIELLDKLLSFDAALLKSQELLNKKLSDTQAQRLCREISTRRSFYHSFFEDLISRTSTLPSGSPLLPPLPHDDEEIVEKLISKYRSQKYSDGKIEEKIESFYTGGNKKIAFKILEYLSENSEFKSSYTLELASKLHSSGLNSNAIWHYNRYRKMVPAPYEAWTALSEIYAESRSWSYALFTSIKALIVSPSNPKSYLKAIFYAERAGIKYIIPFIAKEGVEQLPKTGENRLTLKLLLTALKRFEEAETALGKSDKYEELYVAKTLCFKQDFDNCVKKLLQISGDETFNYIKSYYLANCFSNMLMYESAMNELNKVEISHYELELAKAILMIKNGEYLDAKKLLSTLKKQKEVEGNAIICEAIVDIKTGARNVALTKLAHAARTLPENYEVQLARIIISLEQESHFSMRQLDNYIDRYPADPRPFALKSYYYLRQNNRAAAEIVLDEALKIAPYDSSLLNNMAVLSVEKGDSATAEELLTQAYTFNRHNHAALNNMALLEAKKEQYNDAIKKINRALSSTVTPDLLYTKFYILLIKKDFNAIHREYKLLPAEFAKCKQLSFIYSIALFMEDRFEEAKEAIKKAINRHQPAHIGMIENISDSLMMHSCRDCISFIKRNKKIKLRAGLYKIVASILYDRRRKNIGKTLLKTLKEKLLHTAERTLCFPPFIPAKPSLQLPEPYLILENEPEYIEQHPVY